MNSIIFRFIKDKRVTLIVYGAGLFLIMLLYTGLFPTILEQADKLEELVAIYPEGFLHAFGIDDFRFDTLEKFLAVEYYSIFWPIAMIVFATGLAGFALAREIESGTIEFTLAKPIDRWQIYFGKYFGGLIMLFLFTVVSVFSVIPAVAIFDIDVNVKAQLLVFILSFFFAMAVFSLAFMFSAIVSEKGKVSVFMGGIMIGMYVLNIASSLVEQLEWLQYFSFFYYFDYSSALNDIVLSPSLLIFSGSSLIATAVGLLWFDRRDFSS